jgi:transposase
LIAIFVLIRTLHGMQNDALNSIQNADLLRQMIRDNLTVMNDQALLIEHRTEEFNSIKILHAQTLREREQDIKLHADALRERDRELSFKSARIEQLTQLLSLLRRQQFGARSERFDPAQQALFDAALNEDVAAVSSELEALTAPAVESTKTTREQRQPKRAALPAELPRVEERIEPSACHCGQCGGILHCIGEDISEKLELKPIEFFVRKIIRPKYACRACEIIVSAPTLPAIIERSIAGESLLAHILISKYADHLPLYRQIEMLKRSGVELSKSSMSEWVGACGFALQPLIDAMRAELKSARVIHADETPVHMLDPGRGKTKTAYLFAYRNGEINHKPIIIFDFATSRSGSNARAFLQDYGGALVVDDYAGYKHLFEPKSEQQPMHELACWAHARRKFFELHSANKSAIANEALTRIGALYEIENAAKDMSATARHAHRQQHAAPLIESLYQWLQQLRPKINNNSSTAKAIDYLIRRKKSFQRYLENGLYPIDNNPIENAIRPIAIGRKNWLFAGSEKAGMRAANIMSLIQTAKANGHDPHAYLLDILKKLPTQLNSKIHQLLPQNWQPTTPGA